MMMSTEKADPAATRAAILRITRGLKDWNGDPAGLRHARSELADIIEKGSLQVQMRRKE